jgi:hypothetical protein
METMNSTAGVIRKMLFLALTGFAVVVLFGPILAVLSVVLSFALIGLLVWIPFQMLVLGRSLDWNAVGQRANAAGREVGRVARQGFGIVAVPARGLSFVIAGILAAVWLAVKTLLMTTGLLIQIALMVVTGALVGGLWAFYTTGLHGAELEPALIGNAIIGAGIATVAWAGMTILEKRPFHRPVRNIV